LGQPISGFILQEEALVFSTKLGIDDFVANSGWLRNFKSWHGILELKIYGEKLSADIPLYILEVASYELPEVQNEVLETMATTVCENIADKCRRSDIRLYCIKVDGTKSHSGYEMISIVLKFVYEGKVECCLAVESENMQASGRCDVILNGLLFIGLDPHYIILQCYDGTFVMAGVRSGVQALMQHRVRIRFVRKRYLFSGSVQLIYVKSEIKTDKVFLQSKYFEEQPSLYDIAFYISSAYKIAAMALTNGVSFATCEASFSTCSRILISFRLSVSKDRMRDLVLLPFEPKVLLNMPDEDLLKGFKAVKNHRLQL
ncbi:hypothetical protein T4D_13178, partial [Trichinella pseudospiralis]